MLSVCERLAVRKQATQKSDGGRFNLRTLNELDGLETVSDRD